MGLAETCEDPFTAAIRGFSLFGFTEETVKKRGLPEARNPETVRDGIVNSFQERYGYPGTEPDVRRAWEKIEELFLIGLPSRFSVDYKVQPHNVAAALDTVIGIWGYSVDVSLPAQPDNTYPHLSGEHPEAFVVRLLDTETDETLDEYPLRLFPHATETLAVRNHGATAALLNRTLLDDIGLELVIANEPPGDNTPFILLEQSRLDALEEEYGSGVPLFHREQPLLDRDPLGSRGSIGSYSPENEVDHEVEFGVPEPENTVRLETHPATEKYFSR